MSCARAWPRWRTAYALRVRRKIGRRPRSSEPGPQNSGPITYPQRKTEVTRYAYSFGLENSEAMVRLAEEGAEDAKVLRAGDEGG